jgi:transposase
MPAARYIQLSEVEERKLKAIEENERLHKKVRLRVKVVRLSQRGMSVAEIGSYTGRSESTLLRDLNRWESQKFEGLADGEIPGQRSPIVETEKAYLREKLAEARAWTATTLAEEVNRKFKLTVNRESLRVCLLTMGYTWQRQRYVPVKTPDAQRLKESKETLEGFKKKLKRVKSS